MNFAGLLRAAEGRYIAWLEGDDYWTDSEKLRKQVEYLETHPDVALCFHRALVVNEADERRAPRPSNRHQAPLTTFRNLSRGNYIHTASTVFRAGVIEDLPDWFYTLPTGDWPLFILLAQHGSIGFLEDVMCVYRKHATGLWSGRTRAARREASVFVAEALLQNVEPRFMGTMNKGYVRQCWLALRVALGSGDVRGIARYLSKLTAGVARQPWYSRRAPVPGEH